MSDIETRVRACELENARLRKRLARQNIFWLTGLLLLAGGGAFAGSSLKSAVFDSIKAREVVVVDAKGIVRARLGGDLPNGTVAGGRVAIRGTKAAGLIIYDEEGIERGGYATLEQDSNAVLTLDSKHHMAAMLIAGPDQEQVSALRLGTESSAIEIRSDANGSRMSVTDKAGLTFQQPSIAALHPTTCADQKALALQYPGERICQKRYPEAACQACLKNGKAGE